jgi:cytochrome c oxidase assembly protein subunit 15
MRNEQDFADMIDQKPIALWLLACSALIFAMVILGGVTRLTGSGLSMVEWKPLMGIIPPLTQTQWEDVFLKYQAFPEYQLKNFGMTLAEFKGIFWLEYLHRLLGRFIGLFFIIPMIYFIKLGKVDKPLQKKLIIMFILGGLQGLMGWYMVKSGLVNNPHVSQYRLVAHLGLAIIIYAYIFWTAMDILYPRPTVEPRTDIQFLKMFSFFVATLIFITVLSGGFVAGLKAGLAYNTFPKMNGQWIPDAAYHLEPLWRNFFEDVTTVQFHHRMLAYSLFFIIPMLWFFARQKEHLPRTRISLHVLFLMLGLQVTLGGLTLVFHVAIPLAAAHQAGALILFTTILFINHELHSHS